MVVAAVIAEYNPFHNGHRYQIAATRVAGASHIVAVMSGNFTQRGTPAIAEKRVRARAALLGGADLVIELPLPYAAGTAQRFAFGAVALAEALGCVDVLSFGSESGYLSIIRAAAEAVDSPAVLERASELLKTGMTYARARHLAVSELFGDEVGDMLASPNDTLAVEYVRQLLLTGSRIAPFAVVRAGAGHDAAGAVGEIGSASFLRGLWRSGGAKSLSGLTPGECLAVFEEAEREGLAPLDEAKFQSMMLPVLRRMTAEEFKKLPDLSEGIENRIHCAVRQGLTMDGVYREAKSKRYTASRIRRILLAGFLGLDGALSKNPPPYLRVLGFNARGREILSAAKGGAALPVSDSLAYLKKLGPVCARYAEAEARSTDLYTLATPRVLPCGYDFTADSVRL